MGPSHSDLEGPMHRILFPGVLCALVPGWVTAQGGTAPRHLTIAWGDIKSELPLGRTLSRWQQVYDQTTLPATLTPGKVVTEIGFRRAPTRQAFTADTLSFEMSMYSVPITGATMSSTFATNRSSGIGSIVFQQKALSTPDIVFGNPTDTFLMIPLDVPLPFIGPNVLIETVTSGSSARSTTWEVDHGSDDSTGSFGAWGTPCGPGTNLIGTSSSGRSTYLPGATINVSVQTFSLTLWGNLAVLNIGIRAHRNFPLDLSFAAWPPGCLAYVEPLLSLQAVLGAYGGGTSFPTPNNPILSNRPLFLQWLMVDINTFFPLSASDAAIVRFGPRSKNDGAQTYRPDDNLDTTGTVTNRSTVAVTRFTY